MENKILKRKNKKNIFANIISNCNPLPRYINGRLIRLSINPLASPSAEAPALKYGDVNTVTPSPGEVKGLINLYTHFC